MDAWLCIKYEMATKAVDIGVVRNKSWTSKFIHALVQPSINITVFAFAKVGDFFIISFSLF
jgi:hypothetical protein